MKQRNLNAIPTHAINNFHRRCSKLTNRVLRPGGRFWQSLFTAVVLSSMILFSPLGSMPAHALVAPILLFPANGATITGDEAPPLGIPTFSWMPVTGATLYHIQVNNDIGFAGTMIVDKTTANPAYTPISVKDFPDGTWYWRVRVDRPTPASDWSTEWSYTKAWAGSIDNQPTLIAPSDGAAIDFYDDPIFSWSPVTGAAEYKVQFYTSPGGWITPLSPISTVTLATSYQPKAKLANGTYYWRVVPLDTAGQEGTSSAEGSFEADYNPAITLLEPANLSLVAFTPTFRWEAVRGVEIYHLQYTTDSSFNSGITTINTPNTTYTPVNSMPDDVDYYWRVSAESGVAISDYSSIWQFEKTWNIAPVLLTPTNGYQHVRFPFFSWTPVPGAAYYYVEFDYDVSFGKPVWDTETTANTFYSPNQNKYEYEEHIYYWRVTPYDGSGNPGKRSAVSSFQMHTDSIQPQQVYPLFYYDPEAAGVATNPHEDQSIAVPIFMWHRMLEPANATYPGQVHSNAYRLQVSQDGTFYDVDWEIDTENTMATPYVGDNFTPDSNVDYFWRVCPLSDVCDEESDWSDIWKVQFDPTRGLTPTTGTSPTLIRPANGYEFAELNPVLEWFPMADVDSYDVQISLDPAFGSTVDTASVTYPAYAPSESLAQRSDGDVDFGVYYWRVRETGSTTWSETRRFQIAASSQAFYDRNPGDVINQLPIGSDPAGDVVADLDYDLTTLQASQEGYFDIYNAYNYMYFGFNVHTPIPTTKNITYVLYLDLDHTEDSGATVDAKGYSVTTIPAFQPEYAIYIYQEAGAFSALRTHIYEWNFDTNAWNNPPKTLSGVGGTLTFDGISHIEIQVPNTSIGYNESTGSWAVSLFSLPAAGGSPRDSVPSDPNVPGAGTVTLSRFSGVTERINPLLPFNNTGGDPTVYATVQPNVWDFSIGAPDAGHHVQVYPNETFTGDKSNENIWQSEWNYYSQQSHAWEYDHTGNNTYCWRVQPDYNASKSASVFGAYSQGSCFERVGFIPQNLETSVTFATPTFSWDMVEGAEYYDMDIDTDPGFGDPINVTTDMNSYTPTITLANATYYWRVRIHRKLNTAAQYSDWSDTETFTLALPVPTGLHYEPSNVTRAPTLCWTPVIQNYDGHPVLSAFRYKLQVSEDPAFSTPSLVETIDTEQSCWTAIKGYNDGEYYWHVAMMDGQGKRGDYSATETFVKQYPITTLLSPVNGADLDAVPTFIWTPVTGAAGYRIEISIYDNYSKLTAYAVTHNAAFTPTVPFAEDRTYYWRVAMIDDDNLYGPYNNATIIYNKWDYSIFLPIAIQ
jgi:hypothetical protein